MMMMMMMMISLQTNEERLKVEDKLAEVELQREGLQELIATLKDGRGAEKVVKWQARMEAVALENVRHKRDIGRVKDEVSIYYLNCPWHMSFGVTVNG